MRSTPIKPIIIAGDDDKAQELERGYNPAGPRPRKPQRQ